MAVRVEGARKTTTLLGACAAILFALFAFKLVDPGTASTSLIDRFIPLGLSYYSLRCIHVLMECYLDRIPRPGTREIVEYLFFPATIVAGPIHRYPAFASENSAAFEYARFSEGLERILYGYVKIVVLSNYLLSGKIVPWVVSHVEPGSASYHYIDAIDYGLTIYLQFSGYSDIVIGFALLLGHRVIENFAWPFLKADIVSFWRSWHISLTQLCRDYVFTSVHASTRRAWLGVIATMLAISLWHGVTLNYLAWGLYHAIGLVIYRAWSGCTMSVRVRDALPLSVNYVLGWIVTFQFVMLGFVWTKEHSISASVDACIALARGVLGSV